MNSLNIINNINKNNYLNFNNSTIDETKKRYMLNITKPVIDCTPELDWSKINTDLKINDDGYEIDQQHQDNCDNLNDLDDSGNLGNGNFGKVKIGIYKDDQIAIKTQKPTFHYFNELKVNQKINSNYIVKFHGAIPKYYQLIFELMGGGTLQNFLVTHSRYLDENPLYRIKILSKVAKGMKYLHNDCDPPVIHGDLSSTNVLLKEVFNPNKKNHFKISDFGLSRFKNDIHPFNAKTGHLIYMAPEIFIEPSSQFTEKSDVYSFGILAWEVLLSKVPLPNTFITPLQWMYQVANENARLSLSNLSNEWSSLISSCFDAVPENRPSFIEIIQVLKSIKSNFKIK